MPDFQTQVTYSTQVILPLILSGGLAFGSLITFFLYRQFKEKIFLSVTLFQLCAFSFVFTEAIVNYCGDQKLIPLSFQFSRLEQVAVAFFIPLVPWLFRTISEDILPRSTAIVIRLSVFMAGGLTVIAFVAPDLFISVTHFSRVSFIKEAHYGRGAEGILYYVRDGALVAIFLFSCVWLTQLMKKKPPHLFTRYVATGVFITMLFSANDILNVYTQHNILLPSVLDFSYTTVGFSLFGIFTMFGVLRMFTRHLQERNIELQKIQRMASIGGLEWYRRDNLLKLSGEFIHTFVLPINDGIIPIDQFKTDYIHPDDHGLFDAVIAEVMVGKPAFPFLCRIHPPGSPPCYAFFSSPHITAKDRLGVPSQILWSVQDVTDRKKTEKSLLFLRNYLANIINSMPLILIGVDRNCKVTQWNLEAENHTGCRAKEAEGRCLADVFPRMADKINDVKESMVSRKTCVKARQMYHVKEDVRYEDVTIYPLVFDDVEGAVILLDEVTEHVRFEEMVLQSEKMLSIGGLAAGMAHEINNPLAGIMQNTELLLQRLTRDTPINDRIALEAGTTMHALKTFMKERDVYHHLEMIHSSGNKAGKIVRNMLSFAQRSTASGSLHHISELLDRTLELADHDYDLEKQYDFKNIHIIRDYDPDLPPITCKGTELQQVFFNILKNGAEAMAEARAETGHPEAPCFKLRTWAENHKLCIEIRDNGPGMPDEVRKRVFEPFFTTKDVGKGTGLGLSVSYFIITEHHDGELQVISEPDRGTTFIIKLPADKNP